MDTTKFESVSPDLSQEWATQEYHGKQIHVCTALRVQENAELSGHGQQWRFKVWVTAQDAAPGADQCASAESDVDTFYSTQSIAEDLGFVRGRELVDGLPAG